MPSILRTPLFAAIAVLSASAAFAQGPAAKSPSPDALVQKFAGVWEGSYTSDHAPSGGMRVDMAHDTAWTVSVNIVAEQTMSSRATSVRIEGDRATWKQELMGMSCDASTALEAGALKGQIACDHGTINFELRRRR